MLTRQARRRLAVVLVGARNPQNIGAAARAMQDFGFSDLRVVNEFAPPFEAAQLEAKSAVGAGEVMRNARLFTNLADAIADCGLIAGTTAIGERELRQEIQPLSTAAPVLVKALGGFGLAAGDAPVSANAGRCGQGEEPGVALLFGSEKTGLTNEQLSHCSLLLTIPLFAPEGRHLSMNLGQAVAVCLYELTREGFEDARALPDRRSSPANSGDRERLTSLLLQTLRASGYERRFPANSRPEVVRQLAQMLGGSREQAATWMGIFRLILHRLRGDVAGQPERVEDKGR